LDEHLVEPDSGLGQAISYMLKHWEKLTLFLRQAGAPLDSNIVERALKKAILLRKNALFFKMRSGVRVGDLIMSLIHTCESCGGNPFDYLTQLQRHVDELAQNPGQWMPWNRATLNEAALSSVACPFGRLRCLEKQDRAGRRLRGVSQRIWSCELLPIRFTSMVRWGANRSTSAEWPSTNARLAAI
jgi:hypothetical protein